MGLADLYHFSGCVAQGLVVLGRTRGRLAPVPRRGRRCGGSRGVGLGYLDECLIILPRKLQRAAREGQGPVNGLQQTLRDG